jgi:DNA polymerase III delta subunit
MFYILYGQDDFSLYQAVEKIKADLGDWEMAAANTTSLEGQHLTLSELRNKCDATPLFLGSLSMPSSLAFAYHQLTSTRNLPAPPCVET